MHKTIAAYRDLVQAKVVENLQYYLVCNSTLCIKLYIICTSINILISFFYMSYYYFVVLNHLIV